MNRQHWFMKRAVLLLYFIAGLSRRSNSICSLESISIVRRLKNNNAVLNAYDGELYMPTAKDHNNCSKSMLYCFVKEINVFIIETDQTRRRVLNNLPKQSEDRDHSCPQCELYNKVNANMFLETFLEILQRMCSNNVN